MMLRRRKTIVAAARSLESRGLVVGSTGNVSVRTRASFLITPTRRRYADLRPWEIVHFNCRRAPLGQRAVPSRESGLHRLLYQARPDVNAVVHHHGPYATAASLAGPELQPRLEENEYFEIGPVHVAPPEDPGSAELALSSVAALGHGNAVLLAGHGLVAVGATLELAFDISLAVEHEARVSWLVRTAGADVPRDSAAAGLTPRQRGAFSPAGSAGNGRHSL